MRTSLATGMVIVIAVLLGTWVHAQQRTQQPGAPNEQDALLTEVRALRADIAQLAGASIRTQLLLARLQLQEQRIATLSRQLFDVQAKLNAAAGYRSEAARHVEQFDALLRTASAQDNTRDLESQRKDWSARLRTNEQEERSFQEQANELATLISTEQGRWTEFNDRLDTLEKSLAPAVAR